MWLQKLIRRQRHDEGQSLLETAIAMPLLLGIAFNLINLGYFWFVVLSLAAAPRQGVQYSAQGRFHYYGSGAKRIGSEHPGF